MGALDIAALVVIFIMIILLTVIIVALGSLPGKIAAKRGHPYLDAVNAASWIGLATGVFWPIAFIWAFISDGGTKRKDTSGSADKSAEKELAELRQRIEALEATDATHQSGTTGDN